MASRPSVLFDLDVLLDVLQQREPFFDMSARALACAEMGQVRAWVSAHSLTTLFCLLARHHSADQARIALTSLMTFLIVPPVDLAVIEQALNLPYADFEDAVQMMAAVRSGVQYLVTRKVHHYKAGPLPALQPAELLALVQ